MSKNLHHTIWNHNFTVIFISTLVYNLTTNAVNSMVTSYASFLGAAPMLVGTIAGCYYGAALLFRPAVGPIQMHFSHKQLLLTLFAVNTVSIAGCAFTDSLGMFVVFRIAGGLVGSVLSALGLTVATASLPGERMASGLGVFALTTTIGAALGPAMGVAVYNWGSLQGISAGYYYLFLFLTFVSSSTILGALLLKGDSRQQRSQKSPEVWYRNIIDLRALIPALLITLIDMPYSLFTSYILLYGEQQNVEGISAFFIVFAVTLTLSRPVLGKLMDSLGLKKVALPFAFVYIIGLGGLCFAHSTLTVLLCAIPAAIGFGVLQPTIQTMCMQSVPASRRAIASNTYYFGMDLGRTMAPIIFGGWIYTLTGSYGVMYLTACIFVFLGAIFFLLYFPRFEKLRTARENSC